MSYNSALVAAGCEVLEYEEFGDYQGSWYALVKLNDEIGLVEGSYGSCSGCDSFQAEFDYCDDAPDYQQRLAAFGETYLPPLPIDIRIKCLTETVKEYDWNDDLSALKQLEQWKETYKL